MARLFRQVAKDRSLLLQLTPQAMEVFNTAVRDRADVRYLSVVARSPRPGLAPARATGVDPYGQAVHALYAAIYRLAAQTPARDAPLPTRAQAARLSRAYGKVPSARANDGIVPTLSQLHGRLLHVARADHLDVVGHYTLASEHTSDWLPSGAGFTPDAFEATWDAVAAAIARGSRSRRGRSPGTKRARHP